MKIVVFGPERRVGLWEGDRVVDANAAAADYLSTRMNRAEAVAKAAQDAPADLARFIAGGQPALELARLAAAHVKDAGDAALVQPLASVELHAPWPGRRVFCAGANYAQHILDYMTNVGSPSSLKAIVDEAREFEPSGFSKTLVDVTAPEGDLTYPSRTTQLDYEGELAVVIGRRGRDIPASEAQDYIWGITLANDWSDRSAPFPRIPLSFNLTKNFDGCLSLGPCIVIGDSDPQDIDIKLEVNGEVRQDYNTREMIFAFSEYIAHLSRDMTLVPGDILLGGTGAGTAVDSSQRTSDGALVSLDRFLKVGDLVEVKSPTIGSLRNRVVAKA